jgi:hypothetical protein
MPKLAINTPVAAVKAYLTSSASNFKARQTIKAVKATTHARKEARPFRIHADQRDSVDTIALLAC